MQFKRKSYSPPSYSHIFAGYDRQELSQCLGITKQYLCNVLAGLHKPSKELEARLKALSDSVKAELLEVNNG